MYLKVKALLSDTHQLTRIIILASFLLALAVASFGGYYYYDRYYRPQPKAMEVTLSQAEQAVRDDPQSEEKRMVLAELYLFNRRYDDALNHAVQVMAVNPDNQRAWLVVGVANAIKGNPAEAIEPLQKYVDANKNSEMAELNKSLQSATYFLGDSYLQLNQPDKAIQPLEMAVGWSQTDADSMYKLGLAYTGVQEYDRALIMFHAAATFVPDYVEVYEAMARVYEITFKPDYADYAHGMVAFSKKDYAQALELLKKAVEALPDFAPIHAGLGMTYEAQNNLPEALAAYSRAIELDPANFTASTGKARVEILLNK